MQTITAPSATYVDHMGTDQDIVKAARMSFSDFDQDMSDIGVMRLLTYLARGIPAAEFEIAIGNIMAGVADKQTAIKLYNDIANRKKHWTPFAHTSIKIRCKAPIPLRTQAFKHKIGFVENEESRRYITTEPEIYLPDFKAKPEGSIKQGSGAVHHFNKDIQYKYQSVCDIALDAYNSMLEMGVCPEQARLVLPQGAVVNWVWTGSLYAYFNYVSTRLDPHAQSDAYPMAHDIAKICQEHFPMAWTALMNQAVYPA